MRRVIATLLTALVLVVALPATAKLRVAATLPDLAAVAHEVGGEHAEVTALARPNEDPHYVDPRPSHAVTLSRADLLVVGGLGLEVGWLPKLLVASRNRDLQPGGEGHLDASTAVEKLDVPDGKVDRAGGDIHPGGNPHYAYDPRAMAGVARALGERMAALDPDHAAAYRANGERLAEALEAFAAAERARFAKLPASTRRVVSYHRSMPYLYDWLGLERFGTVEPRPGIAPTPSHVARLSGSMKEAGVRVVVQEEFYPRTTSKTLASMVGGEVVVLPGGARFEDGQSYLERAREAARRLYDALVR